MADTRWPPPLVRAQQYSKSKSIGPVQRRRALDYGEKKMCYVFGPSGYTIRTIAVAIPARTNRHRREPAAGGVARGEATSGRNRLCDLTAK